AEARRRQRRSPDADHRPLLLQVGLLPRAERRPVRDRDDRPGLHRRRAARVARREAFAAAELRAPPRPARRRAAPAAGHPRARGRRVTIASLERPAAGEPEGLLVLLHGRGADERDLYSLLDLLDPERRLLGVTPRGPLSLPPAGAHWYALHRLGYPDPATFSETFPQLAELVDGFGFSPEQTVIGGFSQGGVMTHALSFVRRRPRSRSRRSCRRCRATTSTCRSRCRRSRSGTGRTTT